MGKILILAFSDERTGLGFGALALHELFLANGLESKLFVYGHTSYVPHVFSLREGRLALKEFGPADMSGLVFNQSDWEYLKQHLDGVETLIICGLTQNIPPVLLKEMGAGRRLIWSIDTCSPFTGGCSHTAHCAAWQKNKCAACPLSKSCPSSVAD